MRELLGIRNARLYLLGQSFSRFGDSALWLAMGIWVKSLTGSSAAAGLVFFFFTAPSLVAPAAGLAVDRVRRRPLMIGANAAGGGAVLLLLLVRGPGQLWLIYLVMGLYGLLYQVLTPAESALLAAMVPDAVLPGANAALRTVGESLRVVTPVVGAGIFVLVGAHVVAVIDAATFAVPVVCLSAIRLAEPGPVPSRSRWGAEVAAGLSHIWGSAALRHLVAAAALSLTVFGFSETIIYAIAAQGLQRPPAFVGMLAAVEGAGAVGGGLTAAPLARKLGESRLVAAGLVAVAAGAALQVPPSLAVVSAGFAVCGAGVPWIVVGATTILQRTTPPDVQGRAFAAAETLITTPQTISIVLAAALITVVGYRALLAAMAVVTALAAAYLLVCDKAGRPAPVRALQPGADGEAASVAGDAEA